MGDAAGQTIRIAAALIDDDLGRLLLVRKAGTTSFMQAGGKIEAGENAWAALRRELLEEIGLDLSDHEERYLGRFCAAAANETGCVVEAQLFHVRTLHVPMTAAEIAEAVWVHPAEAANLALAPLTRDWVLPLAAGIASRR
ncbi:NUDIX domain-containing protein [Novosphingobium sp. G106]|uniref:NUDIX hydrolase n=1 Tax=Novosphingobium sp. G106 TaxID=2849500 RepID=UPI001C2D3C99|nr:NUDIX domain-containing protein [Novosphingobium sp. G106]MBV1690130.1 NUDIX domain-containing protein [Novosphingobium sp. G106]